MTLPENNTYNSMSCNNENNNNNDNSDNEMVHNAAFEHLLASLKCHSA
jgi:hypothetical protein